MNNKLYELQRRLSELNRKLSDERDQDKRRKIQIDIERTKNDIKKIDDKENIKKIVFGDEADEKLVDTKKTEAKDLKDKDQSSSLNQTNSDDELKEYIEQKKLERKFEIEQLRKETN